MKKCKILRLNDDYHPSTANSSSSCPLMDTSINTSTITSAESLASAVRRTKSFENLTNDNSDNANVTLFPANKDKAAPSKNDFRSNFFKLNKSSSSDDTVKTGGDLNSSFEATNDTTQNESEDDETYEDNDDNDNDDDDDLEDTSSSDDSSNVSEFSGLSNMSDEDSSRLLNPWLHRQIISGVDPRHLLSKIIGNTDSIPPDVSDLTLWRIIANSLAQPRRKKLLNITTIDDACHLLKTSKNIIVLTGAGVSVSCGIPDFRSRDGIYSRLAVEYPDLPDPQAMFDIRYFSQDPRPFYKFAREIYPGQFKPSACHRFIRKIEERGQLLRNYSQNIDTLENVAGIKNVIECHGSFASASCTKCKEQVNADVIEKDVFEQRIPLCQQCNPNEVSPKSCELRTQDPTVLQQLVANGIMKPDIVFFGEGLPELFHNTIDGDRIKCDLLIVIGSSLKVRPVALIPSWISASVPQILINREPLHHLDFDINLLGDSDVIVNQLCHMLEDDWTDVCWSPTALTETPKISYSTTVEPEFTPPAEPEPQCSTDSTTVTTMENASVAIATEIVTLQTPEATTQNSVINSNSVTLTESSSSSIIKLKPEISSATVTSQTTFSDSQKLEIKRRRIHLPTLSPTSTISNHSSSTSHSDSHQHLPSQQLRHDSVDSAKDSGIEDSTTNSAILSIGSSSNRAENPSPSPKSTSSSSLKRRSSNDDDGDSDDSFVEGPMKKQQQPHKSSTSDKELWNQQNKISLATHLPVNTYFKLANRNYIFTGAEVYLNDIEKFNDERNIHSNPFC